MNASRVVIATLLLCAVLQSGVLVHIYSTSHPTTKPINNCPSSVPTPIQQQQPRTCGVAGLDAVYVLNLQRRPDRRRRMKLLLSSLGIISPVFAKAVDGAVLATAFATRHPILQNATLPRANNITRDHGYASDDEVLDLDALPSNMDIDRISQTALWPDSSHAIHKIAEISCWQSHVRLMGEICRRGKPAMLLEDDVDVSYDIVSRVEQLLRQMPNEWRIVRLGTCGYDPLPYGGKGLVLPPDVWYARGFSCIHALLVHPLGACALNNATDVAVPEHAVDISYRISALEAKPGIVTYVLYPSLALQDRRAGSDLPLSAYKPFETLHHSATARIAAILNFSWNPDDPLYVRL